MSIEDELVSWAASRSAWQQNVLVRLARQEVFDQAAIEELADLLISGTEVNSAPLTIADIPGVPTTSEPVSLVALHDCIGVNALATGQTLTFAKDGLTVIYGDNASGKTGYARPIKGAIGARVTDDVLADVFSNGTKSKPSATFDYLIGTKSAQWSWPGTELSELNQAHFYDEACGDDYLTSTTEVTYRPSALSIFDQLISVCDAVGRAIDQRLRDNALNRPDLPALPVGSPAAIFLKSLSHATSDAVIEAQCTSVPTNASETLGALLTEEARLRASDPTKEKTRLTNIAAQLELTARHCDTLATIFSRDALTKLSTARRKAQELRAAATLASSKSFDSEPLNGVGSETWRTLWLAAKEFSLSDAYHDHEFPVTDASSRCVLCHQELSPDAANRLNRFQAFMTDTTEKDAATAQKEFEQLRLQTTNATLRPPNVLVTLTELRTSDEQLIADVEAWLDIVDTTKDNVANWLTNEADLDKTTISPAPSAKLRERAKALTGQVTLIDQTTFNKALKEITGKVRDLSGAITLVENKDALFAEAQRLRDRNHLETTKKATDTGSITRKSLDLTRKFGTDIVRDRFTRESERLRLQRITLNDAKGIKGQLFHRPTLIGASIEAHVAKVFSEGEQTALGLAGFFTEVHFDPTKSAVILDDPVTSLDHIRRKYVAHRLVEFAKDRQVIVFTHDLAFVTRLRRATKRENVAFTERSIERRYDDVPGICTDHHPWRAKDVGARLNDLVGQLATIKRERPGWTSDQYEAAITDWAGKLSEALERVIRVEIGHYLTEDLETRPHMTKMLVEFTAADHAEYQDIYSYTSEWARRHDKSEDLNPPPPTHEEMDTQLTRTKALHDRIKKYRVAK